jgi:uncharacterized protein (DUF58 family)
MAPSRLRAAATPKLKTYVAAAAFSLFAGLVTGQVELIACAGPFVLAIVLGLVATGRPNVKAQLTLSEARVIEGDEIVVAASITTSMRAEVEMGLVVPAGLALHKSPRTILRATSPHRELKQDFRLHSRRWGAYPLGTLALRLYGPGHLVVYETIVRTDVGLKVYPQSQRIRRAIPPNDTQMYSGDYRSRGAGDGIEFATVRPFTVGDSARRVNWQVTSRSGELHVNLSHPERDSDVVLFLDTFSDAQLEDKTTLDLAVRGASAVAEHHLRHNDRVGLVSFGGSLRWLTASMGRTHTYRIADFLLDVNATFSFAWKNIDLLPQGILPSKATVIAFTPLEDNRILRALADIYERGFTVYVMNVLPEREIKAGKTAEDGVAHRVWLLQREMRKKRLVESGLPVVTWDGETSIEAALSSAPRPVSRAALRS